MASTRSGFILRCTLVGHSMDVRAIAITSQSEIITVSRDKTTILWTEDPENLREYVQKVVYHGHTSYVTSVCCLTSDTSEELIATGSKDKSILIFSKLVSTALHNLTGHTDCVSCLGWKNGYLVSGSWDHSVRIWKDWTCIAILNGHSGPIWSIAVLQADNDTDIQIISASADKTLKLWKNGKDTTTYSGHSDCVRGVVLQSPTRFLSCANDSSVKVWKISGECLATYYGHSNYIYSIAALPSLPSFITGSEDRTMRVWDTNGINTETIYLPAQSVWDVAILPNYDLVAAASDGHCRVFSRFFDRQAPEEEIKAFEEKLSTYKVAVDDIGGIKKSQLPDRSALHAPGKRDGQNLMVREGDKVFCYNWSESKKEWEAVGEVVGGATTGRTTFEGREYDYVFDVDLDEGRVIKLPYNKGDDPYLDAQKFIHKHELPQDYLEQVANFIIKNAGVTSSSVNTNTPYDPFTGGNRYVPGLNSDNSCATSSSDPLTGDRYMPSSSKAGQVVTSKYFPHLSTLSFDSINKEGILNKLKQFNSEVADRLTEAQIVSLVECVTSITPDVIVLGPLEKALQWHPKSVWPALDILRLAFRYQSVQEQWIKKEGRGGPLISLLVQLLNPTASPVNTHLLALRCLSNMACHFPGRMALQLSRESVINATVSLSPFKNKNLEIAASTVILNYSIIFHSVKNIEDHCQIISGAATSAISSDDPESLFRSLVALGNILSLGGDLVSLAKSLDIKPIAQRLLDKRFTAKVNECAADVLKYL